MFHHQFAVMFISSGELEFILNVFDVLVHFKAAIAATKVVLKVPRLGVAGFLKATDQKPKLARG